MAQGISHDVLSALASPEVQAFIRQNEHLDEHRLILSTPTLFGLPAPLLADQLAGRRKAKSKLPEFYQSEKVVYPPSINLEQSSSELTAIFKARLAAETNARTVADLTGGFGIDSYYISKVAKAVHYVEPDSLIHSIAVYNQKQLGAENISHYVATAESFLGDEPKQFDLIYIDPSRRNGSRKVIRLADCVPDIVTMMPGLLGKCRHVLIKASPLLDLHQGADDLSAVERIIVVATGHECKEVLFLCSNKKPSEIMIECLNLGAEDGPTNSFSFTFLQEKNAVSEFSEPRLYLYEPHAWVLKGGPFKLLGQQFDVSKIHVNTHLYTSDTLRYDFPGRVFRIEGLHADRNLPQFFPDNKANVLTRNYPLTPDQLKKKYKLQDGGNRFLIGFSGTSQKHLAAATRVL